MYDTALMRGILGPTMPPKVFFRDYYNQDWVHIEKARAKKIHSAYPPPSFLSLSFPNKHHLTPLLPPSFYNAPTVTLFTE